MPARRPGADAGRPRLGGRVHLPSGAVVCLDDAAARRAAAESSRGQGGLLAGIDVLCGRGVVAAEDGAPLDPLGLPTRDVHVLRALVIHSGVLPEPAGEYTCANCGAPFAISPSHALEIAPFLDGELDDPELDAPFPYEAEHAILPVRVGSARARTARLAARTGREAMPLWRAAEATTLRVTPAVVTAMGIVALGAERRASVVAEALVRAPERAFDSVVALVHDAHYPRRLAALHRCAACGARNDVDVPLARELGRGELAPRRAGSARFPSLDAFEVRVRAIAEEVYRSRGVRNVDLFIDAGVPACDEGGEPLLGCYTPGGRDPELDVAESPEVRLFYRSFAEEARLDPAFDTDAEIRETIDHELTHHLHDLAGTDPLDDEERAEIAREELRHVGRAEAARRARRTVRESVGGFLRTTWPVWAVVLLAMIFVWCAESR